MCRPPQSDNPKTPCPCRDQCLIPPTMSKALIFRKGGQGRATVIIHHPEPRDPRSSGFVGFRAGRVSRSTLNDKLRPVLATGDIGKSYRSWPEPWPDKKKPRVTGARGYSNYLFLFFLNFRGKCSARRINRLCARSQRRRSRQASEQVRASGSILNKDNQSCKASL